LTADGTHPLLLDGSTRSNVKKSYRTPLDHPISNRVHYGVQLARGGPMKSRQILVAIVILGTVWHTAAAQPKKKIEVDAPQPEGIPAGTSKQSNPVLSDLTVVVQAQRTNQITREQAEYLLLQSYQMAMMQYQVLSALHDVLKHDIDEAAGQQARQSLKTTSSDAVLVVPLPGSAPASR